MQPSGMDGLIERAVVEGLDAGDVTQLLVRVQCRLYLGQDGGRQHGGATTFGRPLEPARPLLRKKLHRPLHTVLAHPEDPHEV